MKAIFTHMPSGDPELFPLKAISRLLQADIVVSCPLIRRKITEFVREDCKFATGPEEVSTIFAPVDRGRNFLLVRIVPEEAVNTEKLLNEMAFFEQAGFETEIIPGVSNIQALSASRGFPLTDRNTAQSFWVADGKCRKPAPAFYKELRNVAASSATLVLRNASLLDDVLAVTEAVRKEDLRVLENEDDDLLIIARRPERYYVTGGVFNSSSANRRSAGVLALKSADGSS